MKLFGFGKTFGTVQKKNPLDIVDKDTITGNLFYLQFNVKSLKIRIAGKGNEGYACKVAEIDNKKEVLYLTVLGRAPISKSDKVTFNYDISQIMYTFTSEVLKHTTDHDLCVEYPRIISHFERRKSPRAVFRRNESVELKMVTDPFAGKGLLGILQNVSKGGFCCNISKIIEASTGKDLPVTQLALKSGTVLSIVRFTLAGSGSFDISGDSIHVKQAGYNLLCGLKYGKLSYPQEALIEKFVSSRTFPPSPPDFHAFYGKYIEEKNKPKVEEEGEDFEHAPLEESSRDYSKIKRKEEQEEDSNQPKEVEKKVAPVEKPKEKEVVVNPEVKVKEFIRSESILLVLKNNGEIELITRFLSESGYKKVTLVDSFEEALKSIAGQMFDLIMLDYNMTGSINAEQFITALRRHPTLNNLPIALVSDKIAASETAKIVSFKISRICFRPINTQTIADSVEKILGE